MLLPRCQFGAILHFTQYNNELHSSQLVDTQLFARMAELVDALDSKSTRYPLVVVSFGLTTGQNQKTHKT